MLKHVERTHRGGTSQTPLSSWGALRTPREPATPAVRDGRDRPALILILMIDFRDLLTMSWLQVAGKTGFLIFVFLGYQPSIR